MLYCSFNLVLLKHLSGSSFSKNNYTGLWSTSTSWSPTWASPSTSVSQNITIYGNITSNQSITFGGTCDLIVNDTLVIIGDLSLGNNNNLKVNDGAVLIVKGNLTVDNKTDIAANAYIVVMGNFTKGGSGNQGSFTSNDIPAKVFIGGTVTLPGNTSTTLFPVVTGCTTGTYPTGCNYGNIGNLVNDPITSLISSSCTPSTSPIWQSNGKPSSSNALATVGSTITLSASAQPNPTWSTTISYVWKGPSFSSLSQNPMVTNSATTANTGYYTLTAINGYGCSIKDSVYVLVSSCGSGSALFTRDNYTGLWTDAKSWSTNYVGNTLPPPTDGSSPSNNSITINGTITVNGDLTLTGGTKTICDTLIVNGNLTDNNSVLQISPNGVLIVLETYTGNGGQFLNGSKVVIAGSSSIPYSNTYSGSGSIYLFNPGVIQGFTPTGTSLSDLQTKDPSLYNSYLSVACGVGFNAGTISTSVTSVCSNATVSLTNLTSASPAGGITYQWYSSTNSTNPSTGTWTAISGATADAYSGSVSQTTSFYRMAVKNSACQQYSNVLTVTVNIVNAGTISSDQSVCANMLANAFSTTAGFSASPAGCTYQWQSTTDLVSATPAWTAVTGATAESYTPSVLQTTLYRRQAIYNGCSAYSNSVKLTSLQVPAASIAVDGVSPTNKCLGNSMNLTGTSSISGGTITYDWYIPGKVLADQSGTNNIYSIASLELVNSGDYGLIVKRDGCTSTKAVVTITVRNPPAPRVYRLPNF